jgi:hypothetical protein
MNVAPTLTAAEFADIHNAKCELHGVIQALDGVIHPKMQDRLMKVIALMGKGLASAYEQDDEAYKKTQAHYDEVSDRIGAKTIWAKHEVTDLTAPFTYTGAHRLRYKVGNQCYSTPIAGTTWVDLWRAAEDLVARSGDWHHIFVEEFHATEEAGVLSLSTGS